MVPYPFRSSDRVMPWSFSSHCEKPCRPDIIHRNVLHKDTHPANSHTAPRIFPEYTIVIWWSVSPLQYLLGRLL